ncbi:MAG: hypothetical protein RBS39_01125 [Phycisphaerales bacterium]|nr:hypothetical protein [Phycisphaerales bacterium]
MTTLPGSVTQSTGEAARGAAARRSLLIDLDRIDLSRDILTRADLERFNPHRGDMALIDAILWQSDDYSEVVGVKRVRDNEFWVAGHFPKVPMLPGVLMIEAGAQVSCYQYNVRLERPVTAAFLRIENATFRSSVAPGDELIIMSRDVKFQRKRFVSDIQGVVREAGDWRVAYEARITGIALEGSGF